MHFPTPILGDFDRNRVYEPSEDTFILLDAIEKLVLDGTLQPPQTCLEIGSGSGIVTAFVSSIFKNKCFCIAVDISQHATLATFSTLRSNDSDNRVDIITSDCVSGLSPMKQFDLIVMNPPYVETDPTEISRERIWAGGIMGSSMIHCLLHGKHDEINYETRTISTGPQLSQLLSINGKALIVMAACNKPERFLESRNDNLSASIVLKRRCGRELLSVVLFQRTVLNKSNP